LEMARRLGDATALGPALNAAAVLYDSPADTEKRLALMEEALPITLPTRDIATVSLAHGIVLWSQLELGDLRGFDATMAEAAELINEARVPSTMWWIPQWKATSAMLRGELAEAEAHANETFVMGQKAGDPGVMQTFGAEMFVIRRDQSRLLELEGAIRGMVEEFPAVPAWRCALAVLLAETDRADEARAELEQLSANDYANVTRDNLWLICMALVASAAFLTDAKGPAAAAYPLLAPFEHRFVTVTHLMCEGSVARVLGELAGACGRYDDAVAHFEVGIERDREMGGIRSMLYGQTGLVQVLRRRGARGDLARADALAGEVRAEAERRAMPALLKRVGA